MSGRGKAQKTITLIDAAIRILEEIQPASIRAVCYRLFVEGLIPSMDKAHTNTVSRNLVWAREQGHLPWEWVVDETREAERISAWNNPREFIDCAIRQYRKDYWRDQPNWVEVWSEKGTIRGTLAPVLEEYGVTFRVMHGYGSATAIHGAADESSVSRLTVLYVGDWDPSGMHMSEIDLPKRLERYDGNVEIIRLAINETDIETGIPSFEAATKSGDRRFRWFMNNYGVRCWELDALNPVILRKRVEAEIRDRIDLDAWNHAVKVEAAEIESMNGILKGWPGISMPANKYPPEAA